METAASDLKIRRFKTIVGEGLVVIECLRVRMGNTHYSREPRGVREPGVRRRCGAICARVGLSMCPSPRPSLGSWARVTSGRRDVGGCSASVAAWEPIPHRSVAEGVLAMKPPWLIIVAARW